MNGDAFQRARPGDKMQIAAAAWNACLDAAEAHRRGPGRGRPIEQYRQADIVLCKNTSGSDVARFGVLGIAGVVISPTDSLNEFQSQVAVTGTTPTTAHRGKFVVCLEPIAAGAIGRAWLSGVCQVQVDIAAAGDPFCDVIASDRTKLKSAGAGAARILYREGTGTGTKWCIVRLGDGGGELRIGKVSADWQIGTCASVTLWERESGCMPAAKSPTKTIDDVVNLTQFVPADGWVVISSAPDGKWYLVESEGNPLRIGKTGSQWSKNTTASITLWEGGTPPNETVGGGTIENVVNKWSNVPADKFVGIQRGINGQYYLVVAEC